MPSPEDRPLSDDELRAWDWRATLAEAERSPAWLAKKTGAHYRAVYRYWHGEVGTPIAFLRSAARVLGVSNAA